MNTAAVAESTLKQKTTLVGEPEVLRTPRIERPKAILITQCAQKDFTAFLAAAKKFLPSQVHIGASESERLSGPAGSLVDFLDEAHRCSPQSLYIIHILDQHDPEKDKAHLQRFGIHAICGTDGAKLVDNIGDLAAKRANTDCIKGADLNDCADSELLPRLKQILEGEDLKGVKVAVVGVWTDVKVAYLIRDLITELDADQVATCSALTASNNIQNHFNSLIHLEQILGVKVFHSHQAMLSWLVPEHKRELPACSFKGTFMMENGDRFKGIFSEDQLLERDALIAHALESLGDSTQFSLKPLSGGFSGSQVFLAKNESRTVIVKVGDRSEIAREKFGNDRIRSHVKGHAPAILHCGEGQRLGVMIQELVHSDGDNMTEPAAFQQIAQRAASEENTKLLKNALTVLFKDALGGPLLNYSSISADLFRVFGFVDQYGKPNYAKHVKLTGDRIAARNGFESPAEFFKYLGLTGNICDPADFYLNWLEGKKYLQQVQNGVVHNDLNLVNVLLSADTQTNAVSGLWAIDFARISEMPTLTDFAKVENDLSFIVLPIKSSEEFSKALKMQEIRLNAKTLTDLNGLDAVAQTAHEKQYVSLIKHLRKLASATDTRGEDAMEGYRFALLRYSAHTLSFTEPNHAQRALALCSCGRLAGLIRAAVDEQEATV